MPAHALRRRRTLRCLLLLPMTALLAPAAASAAVTSDSGKPLT